MRTEAKFAVVVVLVAIIGTAAYFFSRNNEKPIELSPDKPPVHATAPKVQEMPLPLGPGTSTVTEKPKETEVTVTPVPEVTEITPKTDSSKPVLKIDLDPLGSSPTTRPGKMPRGKSGRMARGTSAEMLVPNQPAKVDLNVLTETTNSPSSTGQEPNTARVHIVRPGETLYVIAKKYYGRGEMWTVIARANKELHPGSLHAGAKLTIPPAGKAKEHFDGPTTAKAEDVAKDVDKSKGKTYTVKSGDSFSSIAREQLGSKSRWKEIYELNKAKISKPQNLRVGQTIYLPSK